MENPYQNQEHPEQYEIDGVPEKPKMGGSQSDDQNNEEQKEDPGNMQQPEGEGEGEVNLTDEEVFEIAENALLKVAH